MATTTAYQVAVTNEDWSPLIGVDIEAMNLTTLLPDDVQTTGLDGVATFTALPSGPHFFKVRTRRVSTATSADLPEEGRDQSRVRSYTGQVRIQVIAMGNQGITKHFVVDATGMGTHLTAQAAFTAALAQTDNYVVIYCNPGAYSEIVTCDFSTFAGTGELFIYLVAEGSVSNWYSGYYNKVVSIATPAGSASSPAFEFQGVGSIQMLGIYVDGRSGGAVELGDGATDDIDFEAHNCGFDCDGAAIFPSASGATGAVRVFGSIMTSAGAPLLNSIATRVLFHHCRINTKGGLVNSDFGELEFKDCRILTAGALANWWIEEAALVNSNDLTVTGCTYSGGGSGFIKVGQSGATTSNIKILNNTIVSESGDTAIYLIGILRSVVKNNIIKGANNSDGGIGIRVSEGDAKFQAGVVGNNSFDRIQTGLQVDASATDGSNIFGPNAYGDVGTATTGVPAAEDYQVSLSTASCALLDGTIHTDTVAQGVTAGSIIIGNDTPAWDELAISVPAANVLNALGVANGETTPSWKTVLDGTNPANIANSASPGTSLVFAHRDHVHAHPAGLTATLHHTKYTGGEAILAIQGEATLDLEGDVTIAEGKGLSVGGSAVADSINITTSDTDDPYLAFITTKADGGSTPHEFRLTLDQSGGHCHLEVGGQTAAHDTIFCIKCVTGRTATLQIESDAGWGRLNMGTAGSMNLVNTVEDADIRFTVDDGGVDKYLYIDGATFTFLSSTGVTDFGATQIQTGTGVGMKVCTYSSSFGLGLQAGVFEFIVINSTADFRWGYGNSGGLTEKMYLDCGTGALEVAIVNELAAGAGVTIEGTKLLDSFLQFAEITTPANPDDGYGRLYMKNDDKLYFLDTGGTEYDLTGGVSDAADVTYTPTTAADWDSDADPGDVDEALDELAERTTDLEERGVYEYDSSTTAVFGESGIWYNNTPFIGTVNGSPSSTSVVYNHTSGETSLFPGQVLHNTTAGERVLITAVNVGTNTLTVEANSPDDASGWSNTDALTTASQTNTGRSGVFVDIDVTPHIAAGTAPSACVLSGYTALQNADAWFLITHPYEAYDVNKELTIQKHWYTDTVYEQVIIPLTAADSRYYFTLCTLALAGANAGVLFRWAGQFSKLVA